MLPKIIKRNGAEEKFSIINIAKVSVAAGLSPEQAKNLAQTIASWAESLHVPSLTSLQLRDKMLEELQKVNQNAADLYKWYEQSKENV